MIPGAAALFAATPPLSSAVPLGDEPVAVPKTIKQGVDFVYVDPQMRTVAVRHQKPRNWLARVFRGAGPDHTKAANPLFDQMQQGLQQYGQTWGSLPQTKIPAGATLKLGSKDKRVALLRTRLGLVFFGGY